MSYLAGRGAKMKLDFFFLKEYKYSKMYLLCSHKRRQRHGVASQGKREERDSNI